MADLPILPPPPAVGSSWRCAIRILPPKKTGAIETLGALGGRSDARNGLLSPRNGLYDTKNPAPYVREAAKRA